MLFSKEINNVVKTLTKNVINHNFKESIRVGSHLKIYLYKKNIIHRNILTYTLTCFF